jgi:hypothetical protein
MTQTLHDHPTTCVKVWKFAISFAHGGYHLTSEAPSPISLEPITSTTLLKTFTKPSNLYYLKLRISRDNLSNYLLTPLAQSQSIPQELNLSPLYPNIYAKMRKIPINRQKVLKELRFVYSLTKRNGHLSPHIDWLA